MSDPQQPQKRPGSPGEPQPWHAADDKRPPKGAGAPVGTHSFTGPGANVGMPEKPNEAPRAERGEGRDAEPAAQPDPLAEPRAGTGDVHGRRP